MRALTSPSPHGFAGVAAFALFVSVSASSGSLTVTSNPSGASVYVDGAIAGATPITVPNLSTGDHRVRLVKDGYLENGRTVTIAAGQTQTLDVRLTARAASMANGTQQTGSGISSGPPPNYKKWIYIGAAGAGAAATAAYFAARNLAPRVNGVSATPASGIQFASTITFGVNASDPDGDPLTYSWDLGEGATSTAAAPTHLYTTAGTFTPRVTVSDGKHTVDASGSLTIKTMSGTWTGAIVGNPGTPTVTGTFVLTQSGTSITGTYSDVFGPGTVTGSLQTAAPLVRMTIAQTGFTPFVFTGTPGNDANSVSGNLNGSGFVNTPLTISRQ